MSRERCLISVIPVRALVPEALYVRPALFPSDLCPLDRSGRRWCPEALSHYQYAHGPLHGRSSRWSDGGGATHNEAKTTACSPTLDLDIIGVAEAVAVTTYKSAPRFQPDSRGILCSWRSNSTQPSIQLTTDELHACALRYPNPKDRHFGSS